MSADETIAALDALIHRIDSATKASVRDSIGAVESKAKGLAHVKTGAMRRSILPTPVMPAGPHVFTAMVGPTVVYGRQKELGGHIFPVRARALRFLDRDGHVVFRSHVYQHPIPFLKPGFEATDVRGVFVRHIRDAIVTT